MSTTKPLPKPYLTVRQPKRSRSPQNFPKMKYRARKRQHRNHVHFCLPQDPQIGIPPGAVHVSIVPVTNTFHSQIKCAIEAVRRIALGLDDVGPAAERAGTALDEMAPNLAKGSRPSSFLMDEAFREDVHTAYSLSSLPAARTAHLPIAVLNPNVRKRR